jgi:putative ABC transport system substrate-binding protein
MNRRAFVGLLGAAAAWPSAAPAQQPPHPVVGILDSTGSAGTKLMAAFRDGLSEGGVIAGRHAAIEQRSTEQYAELQALADELVGRRVTVIAALGGLPAKAAKAATATIPIVFCVGGDPVELGLVASLNRPGANLTGATFFAAQLLQKQLGILQELVPGARLIGVLVNPNNPRHRTDADDLQAAARMLGLEILVAEAGSEHDLDSAFDLLRHYDARAIILAGDAFFFFHHKRIAASAARHAIPMMYNLREYVVAGGLMSYGASVADAYRQAGIYTARIVKGEKPGDLPIIQPTKFDLVINLKTAKALDLAIPDRLLALADEVIE